MAVHADAVPDAHPAADGGGKDAEGLLAWCHLYGNIAADGLNQTFLLQDKAVAAYITADTVADQLVNGYIFAGNITAEGFYLTVPGGQMMHTDVTAFCINKCTFVLYSLKADISGKGGKAQQLTLDIF